MLFTFHESGSQTLLLCACAGGERRVWEITIPSHNAAAAYALLVSLIIRPAAFSPRIVVDRRLDKQLQTDRSDEPAVTMRNDHMIIAHRAIFVMRAYRMRGRFATPPTAHVTCGSPARPG